MRNQLVGGKVGEVKSHMKRGRRRTAGAEGWGDRVEVPIHLSEMHFTLFHCLISAYVLLQTYRKQRPDGHGETDQKQNNGPDFHFPSFVK